MKGIAGYIVAAVVLAALGALCIGASRLNREMANAQQTLLLSDYAAADASLSAVERYYAYGSRVPGIGPQPLNDVRARKAALSYWQRRYAALAPPERADPVADVPSDNISLQLIVADAVYRDGQPRGKDRRTALEVLNSAISAYRTVLNNPARADDSRHAEAAAYNYEYVVRLRDEILKGRRRALPPQDEDASLGAEGISERAVFEPEFEQYVPLEKEERDKPAAGVSDPPARKG